MTATIELAIAIFGLAPIFWAMTATDKSVSHRAAGAGVGLIALLIALLLRRSEDSHDWRDRS
jgi:hypothetical protein